MAQAAQVLGRHRLSRCTQTLTLHFITETSPAVAGGNDACARVPPVGSSFSVSYIFVSYLH